MMPVMRRILETGANKGIGLAIAKRALVEHADTFVLLGSRDAERGHAAVEELAREEPAFKERLMLLEIDVSQDQSVAQAAHIMADRFGRAGSLYGVVNNAGVGTRGRTLE